MDIVVSPLPHLWLIDLDGTIVRHNGHLVGEDSLLPGVKDFWKQLPSEDKIVLLTARSSEFRDKTLGFLRLHDLRYDTILFDLPKGERILINDQKVSGLTTAIAYCPGRDQGLGAIRLNISEEL